MIMRRHSLRSVIILACGIMPASGIDENGDIVFEHTIVGSTCDKKELESSVAAVLEVSDDYDDKIVERWGGKRALDRIQ